ncbi:hypothetical protein [Magnetospirillum sulfuroxidans]|uniref:Uncharacterized protein n=1 Tax=Magnetospirillum sulfuroxidans TaxID=611300 RepID=A0ABS5IDH7_9PROT|nr:hypothetical protein [Magnetospirillum sulfuroxidans]MBR9972487.1 hypothetical protein [Magnetospirillum sulfuroxidans]
MTPDRLDALIRRNFPATEISATQVNRVVDGVLARLEQNHPVSRWQSWLRLLSEITPSIPSLMRQSAIPVGVALALGLYVGQFLQPMPQDTAALASLMPASSVLLTGY